MHLKCFLVSGLCSGSNQSVGSIFGLFFPQEWTELSVVIKLMFMCECVSLFVVFNSYVCSLCPQGSRHNEPLTFDLL